MIVIPAINAAMKDEAAARIKEAAQFAKLLHLDVADGVFTPNTTWGTPEELVQLVGSMPELGELRFEIHLMVENPDAVVAAWFDTKLVTRVVVHVEAAKSVKAMQEIAQQYGGELMLSVAPDTDVKRLLNFRGRVKLFQVLAVSPGIAGQKFNEEVINKIKKLHALPDVTIEVDGGVNFNTGRVAKEAGADILVSASYISGSRSPQNAYDQLRAI